MYSIDIGARWLLELTHNEGKQLIVVVGPTSARIAGVRDSFIATLAAHEIAFATQYSRRTVTVGDTTILFASSIEPDCLRGLQPAYVWGFGYNDWHNKNEVINNLTITLRYAETSDRFLLTV